MKFCCAALTAFIFCLPAAAGTALADTNGQSFRPFSATYRVLKEGEPIGESRFTLQRSGGNWLYASKTSGTSGLAGWLGARVEEKTRFRLAHGRIELLRHEYLVRAAFYERSRTIDVDWQTGSVHVEDSREGKADYATVPGLIGKQLLSLALGRRLLDPGKTLHLPVAVHNRVRSERFRVAGTAMITVPAGTYQATRVDRIDDDHAMSAWYTDDIPVPVKLAQDGDGQITLVLTSFQRSIRG